MQMKDQQKDYTVFDSGSTWGKWDLHVHPPGTMKACKWKSKSLDDFCTALVDSNCRVVGITDYFSVDKAFEVREILNQRDDRLIALPNLELRDPTIVAKKNVNYHIIFSETLCRKKIKDALSRIDVVVAGGRKKSMTELTREDIETATVAVDHVVECLNGRLEKGIDYIVVFATGNDGYRPINNKNPSPMAVASSEQFVVQADGFFGNQQAREHWISPDNFDRRPRPVFSCSDAHDEERFKSFHESDKQMWIRSIPGFRGLIECLVEPKTRIRFRNTIPESKDPSKTISRVTLKGEKGNRLFSQSIELNSGINSIIGSRSSGKSVLLSSIAFAVDPEGTVEKQKVALPRKAARSGDFNSYGPANAWTWADALNDYSVEVQWANGDIATFADPKGSVVYLPQGYLNNIAENEEHINALVRDMISSLPGRENVFDSFALRYDATVRAIGIAVDELFTLLGSYSAVNERIRELGDAKDLDLRKRRLEEQKATIVRGKRVDPTVDLDSLEQERRRILEALDKPNAEIAHLETWMREFRDLALPPLAGPVGSYLNEEMAARWESLIEEFGQFVEGSYRTYMHAEAQANELNGSREELVTSEVKNNYGGRLPEELSDEMAEISSSLKQAISDLDEMNRIRGLRDGIAENCLGSLALIQRERKNYLTSLAEAVREWNEEKPKVNAVSIALESGHESSLDEVLKDISLRGQSDSWKSLLESNEQIDSRDWGWEFIFQAYVGELKINAAGSSLDIVKRLVSDLPTVRPVAEYDDDRIGGFSPTSMSAGKRALVGLEFILGSSGSTWPLLIDQPEDDLDSRSIFDSVVPYLRSAREHRQIVMVTHDANLVVGSDSELVTVCNRNSAEYPNPFGSQFWYASGAFEEGLVWPKLPSGERRAWYGSGVTIVEHVCKLLDGGVEAFAKRVRRYPW